MLLPRPLVLKPKGRKPPALGPEARAVAVHLSPSVEEAGLTALIEHEGLADCDKDGLLEHTTNIKNMWQGACQTNLVLEFELAEPVALGAIEVWNFNAEWQTADGVRRADVAVSADGASWQTVLRGAAFAQAAGNADYDDPTVLALNGVKARRVRFEHLETWGTSGKIGLSKVAFHRVAAP